MRVVWTTPARLQLIALQDYIAERNPAAAYRVAETIRRRVAQLSENPMMGRRGRDQTTRELVIGKTPYVVGYRVTDRIEVVAVLHGARDWPESL